MCSLVSCITNFFAKAICYVCNYCQQSCVLILCFCDFCIIITIVITTISSSSSSNSSSIVLLSKPWTQILFYQIKQLGRNVLTYTTTHKEQLKTQALSTQSLRAWAHFSGAVLFCQPHQQLFTHSSNYFATASNSDTTGTRDRKRQGRLLVVLVDGEGGERTVTFYVQ